MMVTANHFDDDLFVVVGPKSDCTPDECRAIGAALRAWLTTHGYARRVYGLDDLEAGRKPRSPASYVIHSQDRYPDERWPVALLAVAPGTDLNAACADVVAELGGLRDRLSCLMSPETYDAYTR